MPVWSMAEEKPGGDVLSSHPAESAAPGEPADAHYTDYIARIKKNLYSRISNNRLKAVKTIRTLNLKQPGILKIMAGMLLHDADPQVRREAAVTLHQAPPSYRSILSALADAVRLDSDPGVRKSAAWTLSIIRSFEEPAVFKALMKALRDDSDPHVRRIASQALGAGPLSPWTQNIQDALLTALAKDSDPQVRQWSAWSLGEIPINRYVISKKLVYAAQHDIDSETRAAADRAYMKLTNQSSVRPLCERIFY